MHITITHYASTAFGSYMTSFFSVHFVAAPFPTKARFCDTTFSIWQLHRAHFFCSIFVAARFSTAWRCYWVINTLVVYVYIQSASLNPFVTTPRFLVKNYLKLMCDILSGGMIKYSRQRLICTTLFLVANYLNLVCVFFSVNIIQVWHRFFFPNIFADPFRHLSNVFFAWTLA